MNPIKEYIKKQNKLFDGNFDDRFMMIAKMADKSDGVGYGKGLARLQSDIKKFNTSSLEGMVKVCAEMGREIEVPIDPYNEDFVCALSTYSQLLKDSLK